MADPQDMILPFLHEIRADMRAGFERIGEHADQVDKRFDALERCLDAMLKVVRSRS
ncbi:hypothetical protein [Methylobacterium nigriterrae]|uniref:hypothetical protein n=1 Tax=Methylobacterium nigriterrae TaxID=3127512 RepID=UPI0030140745